MVAFKRMRSMDTGRLYKLHELGDRDATRELIGVCVRAGRVLEAVRLHVAIAQRMEAWRLWHTVAPELALLWLGTREAVACAVYEAHYHITHPMHSGPGLDPEPFKRRQETSDAIINRQVHWQDLEGSAREAGRLLAEVVGAISALDLYTDAVLRPDAVASVAPVLDELLDLVEGLLGVELEEMVEALTSGVLRRVSVEVASREWVELQQ